MAASESFRSLNRLAATAPTARVLNLGLITGSRAEPVPRERRLFQSAMLDRSIIVKHRLRADERHIFKDAKASATKVLIPVDPKDLSAGASNVFVDEPGWSLRLAATIDFAHLPDAGAHDLQVLRTLDAIPSLDPFLAREQLISRGFCVDESYFAISSSDLALMSAFVKEQIVPLVALCLGGDLRTELESKKLAEKLLRAELDETMEPLRLTLRLEKDEFREGIFCWKGFLYYKWVLANHLSGLGDLVRGIKNVGYTGAATIDEKVFLAKTRHQLPASIMASIASVRLMLQDYDHAFCQLTEAANPTAFKEFLLAAPIVFSRLGDQLGALQHMTSFWNYRKPKNGCHQFSAPELVDVLKDFTQSVGESEERLRSKKGAD